MLKNKNYLSPTFIDVYQIEDLKLCDDLIKYYKSHKKEYGMKGLVGANGVLNKKAKEIKLTNIFDAVDEKVKTVQCKKESKKGCNGKSTKCLTHNLWDELENHINDFFEKKSLEDLIQDNIERRI